MDRSVLARALAQVEAEVQKVIHWVLAHLEKPLRSKVRRQVRPILADKVHQQILVIDLAFIQLPCSQQLRARASHRLHAVKYKSSDPEHSAFIDTKPERYR